MMTITDIHTYAPSKDETFLIDTNVWLYLFCPLGNYKPFIIKPYENFFDRAIKNGSVFYISSLIVSEFINRYFRLEFNILNTNNKIYKDFKKDFRPSQHYKSIAKTIRSTLKQNILKIAKPLDDNFSNLDINKIVDSIDTIEFNDEYISTLSLHSNLKIITSDSDFKFSKVDANIITGNGKLLKKFIN